MTRQVLPVGLSTSARDPVPEVLLYPQLPLFSFAQMLNCSAHTPVAPKCALSDTNSQTPKLKKMDNSKATEDNPPSQDTLATSEAPFPTPENSDAHQVSWKQFLGDTAPPLLFTCLFFYNKQRVWNVGIPGPSPS
ncbi:hypothetical protein A6R68_09121 [Neotoma lepida]|uniref:Uncharacterized protein n=1 Tax=Neotoma lepida TaxID=56216 RepID=A0A1A6G0P0_NEOLE|nr:hypothetical protein A6R68_09121 [Neotoma lepida]